MTILIETTVLKALKLPEEIRGTGHPVNTFRDMETAHGSVHGLGHLEWQPPESVNHVGFSSDTGGA